MRVIPSRHQAGRIRYLAAVIIIAIAVTLAASPLTASAADDPLAPYTVDGVTPRGTTINLFDYWLTDRGAADNIDPAGIADLGINAGHVLDFNKNASRSAAPYEANPSNVNKWTASAHPRTAIAAPTLGADGYPTLSTNLGGESLAYLFSNTGGPSKQAFPGVTGLLQVDDQGYYSYNSQTNFAQFNESTNAFTLYNAGGVNTGGASPNGQFFPFNTGAQVFNVSGGALQRNGVTSVSPVINHYFGMSMATRFIQQYGGHVDESQTMPVTYNFSGDDDVWVYIDDVLVGDLGGIHNASSLEIDFATGAVTVYWDRNNNNAYDAGVDTPYQQTTLADAFAAAGSDTAQFAGPTFADDTYHTLDFYYLERGNTDSNMSLKYNLVSIPESGIRKVDQNGAALGGAQFQLFPADAQYQPIGDAVYEGTTDPNGELVFTNEHGFPITLEQLDAQYDYMVLREVGAPAGYRHPGDMHLRFENGVLLSTNEWDTGAWSQAKLTATATDPIRIDNGDGTVGVVDPSGGTMFAVIMKRRSMSAPVDDPANWAPVSGDALAGWQVGADNSLASIVQAVRATPYPFALGTNGAYQVEVDNLPGDVNQYYGMLAINGEGTAGAQCTVQYYSVAGSGGADGASARTIHRILTEPDAGYAGFSYAYSVRLYIANIRNGFLVAKTDTAGNPLAGATFALYRRADMVDVTDSDTSDTTGAAWTVRGPDGNGTVTLGVAPGVSPVDEATIGDDGGLAFPTAGHTLDPGDYVLVETAAPDGYVANARAVPVVVNDQGVFADAGVADDGVRVDLGVGYLVRSMVQFAADDDIDATLHDVTAVLQTSATAPGESAAWQPIGETTYLRYAGDGNLQYVPDGAGYPQTLGTDAGWSRLTVTQCMEHNTASSPKQNLGGQDLSNLFTGSVIVHVADRRVDEEEPDQPDDPIGPSDPSDPSEPSEPSEPSGPSDPSDPSGPSDPSEPDGGDADSAEPPEAIADSGASVVTPIAVVAVAAAMGVILFVVVRRRRKEA